MALRPEDAARLARITDPANMWHGDAEWLKNLIADLERNPLVVMRTPNDLTATLLDVMGVKPKEK